MSVPDSSSSRFAYLAAVSRDARKADWTKTNRRAALVCLPVIAAWLFYGLISGHHPAATLAVAGAFTVGFGGFQRLATQRFWPLVVTLAGVAATTWLGAVAGHAGWLWLALLTTVAGWAFGVVTTLGYGAWWVGLQWLIGLIAFGGAHPAPPGEATLYAVFLILGGTAQLIVILALSPWIDHWFRRQDQPALDVNGSIAGALRAHARPSSPAGRHALRVTAALAIGTVAAHAWKLPNGYWMPMTSALLLKPVLHETTVRSVGRLVGTLAGAGLMTLLVAYARPTPAVLGVLVLLAAWGCFTLQRVNYALFAVCVTAYVVLLLSLIGLPEPEVALRRIEATLAGAAVALLVHVIPTRRADGPTI